MLTICVVHGFYILKSYSITKFVKSWIIILCKYRFDGRALLDFIREPRKTTRTLDKSEEEEELEEFVNFERFRDLIKHRRRGCRYFFILVI